MSKPSSHRRPDIQGLRAVAVLLVVLYHYGLGPFTGGFIGVDVFFVISGFVITLSLRRDIEAGTFSILGFYDRRVRRILPALLTVLAATMAAGWFILMPGDYADLGESAAYAAFGLGNLFFFWNTGYFDQVSELQPLLHTWSLGVEEQFYFVWPAALWLALTVIKSKRLFIWLFGACLAIAFAYAVRKTGNDPTGAFYLPYPRAWELAIGAILVFLPTIRSAGISHAFSIIGIALIGYSALSLTAESPFPGLHALAPCAGAALLVWPKAQTDLVSRVLAVRPAAFVGDISYSLYLWHWPVLVFYRFYANEPPSPVYSVLLIGACVLVAAASFYLVEERFRKMKPNRQLLRWRNVATGTAVSVLFLFAGANISWTHGFSNRISPQSEAMSDLDTMWQWNCPREVKFPEVGKPLCNFGTPWEFATDKVLLWGDSHADHFAPLIETALEGTDTSVILFRGCPAAFGEGVNRYYPAHPKYPEQCEASRKEAVSLLSRHKEINVVVLPAAWSTKLPVLYTDRPENMSVSRGAKLLQKGLEALAHEISAPARRLVLVGDVPQWKSHGDAISCLQTRETGLWREPCNYQAIPRKAFDELHGPTYQAIRQAAADVGATAVLPGLAMCDDKECLNRLNGEFLYRDGSHLRRNLKPETRRQLAHILGLAKAIQGDAGL